MKKIRFPPLLADLLKTTLASCEGVIFDQAASCPDCGGLLSGYDIRKKQFALLAENDQKRVVNVLVKRFRCTACGRVCLADEPFYPDTRIGSPVVDLCMTLGEIMPYSRVSSCLAEIGIVVDRWSVRNYRQKHRRPIPSADMFGFRLPLSIVSLSSLAMAVPDGGRIAGSDLLRVCNYPSRTGNPIRSGPGTGSESPAGEK